MFLIFHSNKYVILKWALKCQGRARGVWTFTYFVYFLRFESLLHPSLYQRTARVQTLQLRTFNIVLSVLQRYARSHSTRTTAASQVFPCLRLSASRIRFVCLHIVWRRHLRGRVVLPVCRRYSLWSSLFRLWYFAEDQRVKFRCINCHTCAVG